jgi:hypothetical protein
MSKWSKQRKTATEAGAYHAQGGDDRRAEFASRGSVLRDAYDKGFQNEQQEMARRQEAQNHPLRAISREANRLVETIAGDEPRQLAELVERLADYILEQEETHGR